ncbi:unnamed protein product [Durusdinium trenchii]|uniref:Pseudouridine synthase RsuA/RluA-like domain-containing protein n=2 Tax=Durusdinium trenchii TaxID=1381693 RepID=A0ABP0RPD5_9DINO
MASCDNLHQWRRALEALETLQSADLRLDTDSDDFAPCCDLAISACAKGSNWQGALEMLTKMKGCSMRTGDVTYSAAITACSNTEEWRVAMALCGELMMCHLEPGIWCTASAHACDKVGAWLQALSIFEWVSDRTEVDGALAGSVLSSLSSSKGASCALELLRCLGRQWQPAVPEVEVEAGSAGVLCHRPGIVVVNKASGESTESLLLRCSKSFGIQLRLASRLDAPTSGVLPLACGESAGKYLQAQFAGRLVRKDYICLCAGPSLGEMHSSAVISQPLLTTGQDGINSRTIVSKIGRPAKTAYVVQARYWHSAPPVEEQELILLRVRPLTGRTHQIRVHLASIGRPILGDMVYGTPAVGHACFRLFLHCAKLRLFDFTGSTFTAEAPLPAALRDFLEALEEKVGAAKQQLEIPLDVVADIPGKVDSSDFVDIKLDARNLIEADVKSALTDLDWFGKVNALYCGKAAEAEMDVAAKTMGAMKPAAALSFLHGGFFPNIVDLETTLAYDCCKGNPGNFAKQRHPRHAGLLESLQIAAPLGRLWHFAALQPGALVGLLRLRGFYEVAPMGLTKLLGRGCLRQVEMVEIEELLVSRGALELAFPAAAQGIGCSEREADWLVAFCIGLAKNTSLKKTVGFEARKFSGRVLEDGVREMPLSIWDLPNLFAAHDLETLELQVHSGANVKPEVVILVGCGGKMALTVLLSLGLTRLCYLRVDSPTDAKLKEELTKACRPNIGGIDEEVDAGKPGFGPRGHVFTEPHNYQVAAVLQAQAAPEWGRFCWALAALGTARTDSEKGKQLKNLEQLPPVKVRFGPLTGRPGRREHHKFGAADRKATYYYRFHKLIGKANWRKYIERYVAPRSIENRQRWIPTPWPTYQQGKHARSWNWRLPKGLAAATTGDDVLEVWIKFRHKLPKKTFHYFKLLKRLTEVGGCERTDWRLRFVTSRLHKIHRKVLNLPRLAKYYAELNIINELEHVSRFIRKMLPRYNPHQLALTAHAFGIAKLQDKDMMAKIARLIAPRLSEITPMELVRLAQAYASTEVCHYTLLAQLSAQAQVRVQQASTGEVIPGSCPSFSQLVELAEAFAQLKFQDYSFFEMVSLQAETFLLHGYPGPTPPALAGLCQACARLKVHEIRLFEVILAHVEDNWYDYPAWSLAEIGAALAPIMPSARFENVYRQMLTQIRHDRDTLNLRGLTAAARFMAEVDHKGQFLPGFAEALAQRFMALKDESKERYDVARVTEIFAKRCPEDQALFSTLCRHLHRHLGIFEPVDFVRFTRGLAASEYRDQRVTHALPKWAQKRHQEFSPHDWDSFVTSLTKLGASDVRESQLREIGPPAPSEPATFSGGQMAMAKAQITSNG